MVLALHTLERKILPYITENTTSDTLIEKTGLKEIEVMRALQWLSNKELVTIKENKEEYFDLDVNGLVYKEKGLPERNVLQSLEKKSLSTHELKISKQEVNIVIGSLKREKLITISKKNGNLILTITEEGKKSLNQPSKEEKFLQGAFPKTTLSKSEKEVFTNLQRRKQLVKTDIKKTVLATLSKKGKQIVKKGVSEDAGADKVTPEMLSSGKWKEFRPYDVSINVAPIHGGRKHFVNEAIEYIRKIWLSMGFTEMEGSMVQTAFWNLDALFIPQDHPARQMQDTFYVKNPSSGKLPQIHKEVKKVHEDGGKTGSKGWGGEYSTEEAAKNLLRTHNTVLSAQTIANLKEIPAKFFSVGKVFRNEALDYKHLFEFYQVEGIVVDPDANFKNLIGYLREFFMKMGYLDVRIRPAYFPYTTMSAEVEVLHPKRGWIELGGSGIFRPEVTVPLIGKEVPVLAWGLGMGRIIGEYWNITDIRDLYRNDIEQLQNMKAFLK